VYGKAMRVMVLLLVWSGAVDALAAGKTRYLDN
jgi:hypothetical protein